MNANGVVEVVAEYNCGHAPRTVLKGSWLDLKKKFGFTEQKIVLGCPICGSGAAYVSMTMNGELVARAPAEDFIGVKGATVSFPPPLEAN